ncbi:MAG: hypothetical protein OEZ06_28715 [Myxococcales bacterium]|nr:hypothetical protein [Myxococcales bacterium]
MSTTGGCAPRCHELGVSECEDADDCESISGRPLIEAGGCLDEHRFAGCQPADRDCGDAFTTATAPDGTHWLFSSTCHPDGWSETGSSLDETRLCSEPAADAGAR